jgi:hypothetical protein
VVEVKVKVLMIVLLLTLSLAPFLQSTMAEGTVKDVKLHLSGLEVLGTGKSDQYSATLVDPQNRNWGYEVFVTAENITGAMPLEETPATGNLTALNRSFKFDITTPMVSGELTININISSESGEQWYLKKQTIEVVAPVTIMATVDNPSDMDVRNATVRFYVDGEKIDTQTIGAIPAGQFTEVRAEWITAYKPPGWHDSKIEVDLNGDGIIDQSMGDTVISDKFFVEGGENWIVWITILVGLVALLLGVRYISKRKIK